MPRDKGDPAFVYDILQAAADIKQFLGTKMEADFLIRSLRRDSAEFQEPRTK